MSVLWSNDPALTTRRVVVLFLLYLGALGVAKKWPPRTVLLLVVFSGTLHLVIGVARELYLGRFNLADPVYRFSGTLHPNQQGQACVVLTLAAIAAVQKSSKGRALYRFIAVFGFIFLLLTRSRTSVAAFVAALAVYMFMTLPRARKWRLIYLGWMVVLILIVLMGELFWVVVPSMFSLGRSAETVNTLTGRIPLWRECLIYVRERPVFGHGFEAFWTDARIDDVSSAVGWGIQSAHSAVIDLLLNLGAVGFALHTVVLVLFFVLALRMHRATGTSIYPLVASLVITVVALGALESTTLLRVSSTTFHIVAVMLASSMIERR